MQIADDNNVIVTSVSPHLLVYSCDPPGHNPITSQWTAHVNWRAWHICEVSGRAEGSKRAGTSSTEFPFWKPLPGQAKLWLWPGFGPWPGSRILKAKAVLGQAQAVAFRPSQVGTSLLKAGSSSWPASMLTGEVLPAPVLPKMIILQRQFLLNREWMDQDIEWMMLVLLYVCHNPFVDRCHKSLLKAYASAPWLVIVQQCSHQWSTW